jgi:hypothetical protein
MPTPQPTPELVEAGPREREQHRARARPADDCHRQDILACVMRQDH